MPQQEQTQRKALRALSHQAGGSSVPPCKYIFPSNHTEMAAAMSIFKAAEGGMLMSIAETMEPEDTPAAVLLSSMASVAARQNALLHSFVAPNLSLASFDTPMSDVWAYNLALTYVSPGSCKVEQRLPLLPTLSAETGIATTAWPGRNLTFIWDAAAQAAASRSGNPLFIGWVNQVNAPIYSVLVPLGDGRGTTRIPNDLSGTAFAVLTTQPGLQTMQDLTEATLAGPVVVSLFQ